MAATPVPSPHRLHSIVSHLRAQAASSAAAEPDEPAAGLRARFARDGFVVLQGAISPGEMAGFKAHADALVQRVATLSPDSLKQANGPGHSFSLERTSDGELVQGFLHKVQGVTTAERRFLGIAGHPSILPVVQALLGSAHLDIFVCPATRAPCHSRALFLCLPLVCSLFAMQPQRPSAELLLPRRGPLARAHVGQKMLSTFAQQPQTALAQTASDHLFVHSLCPTCLRH